METKLSKLPRAPHYGIVKITTVYERDHYAEEHGSSSTTYPTHHSTYEAYTTKEEWEEAIRGYVKRNEQFLALEAFPATVETKIITTVNKGLHDHGV